MRSQINKSLGTLFETETLDRAWQHPDLEIKKYCVRWAPTGWLNSDKRSECVLSTELLGTLGERQDLTDHDAAMLIRAGYSASKGIYNILLKEREANSEADSSLQSLKRMHDLYWTHGAYIYEPENVSRPYVSTKPVSELPSPQDVLTADFLQTTLNEPNTPLRLRSILICITSYPRNLDWLNGITRVLTAARNIVNTNLGATSQQMGNIYAVHKMNLVAVEALYHTAHHRHFSLNQTSNALSQSLLLSLEIDNSSAFASINTGMNRKILSHLNIQRMLQATKLLSFRDLDADAIEAGWELIGRCADTAKQHEITNCSDLLPDFCDLLPDFYLQALKKIPTCDDNRIAQLVTRLEYWDPAVSSTLLMLPQTGPTTAAALLKCRHLKIIEHIVDIDLERQENGLPPLLDDQQIIHLAERIPIPHDVLVHRKNLPLELFEVLSTSPLPQVRLQVAKRPDTPPAVRTMLAFDNDRVVATAAAKRLKPLKDRRST